MQPSDRLSKIAPYLFAELERKIAEKQAAGIDVISLGIGDPDMATFPQVVQAAQAAVADPGTHRYPSNRGRIEFRDAVSAFYARRFGVELDPATEVIATIGAKECIFNLNLAFLNPGDVALACDPGYPVYSGGPLIAGGEPVLLALKPELGFAPDLDAISPEILARAKLLYFNYPNNPTGAVAPEGFYERVVALCEEHDILAVSDLSYSETTYDGYVAPSFLATPGARDVGVEVFSLSKGYNMTGWRCAALVGHAAALGAYWKLKSNIDSGNFDAVQLAGARALEADVDDEVARQNAIYARRRDLVVDALAAAGVQVTTPKGAGA
jgi:LL-diaminopimelate aminotransferase